MLVEIDAFLLNRIYRPLAWSFERRTGRTNFYLAEKCFSAAILTIILLSVSAGMQDRTLAAEALLFVVVFVLFARAARQSFTKMDERARREPEYLSQGLESTFFRIAIRLSMWAGIGFLLVTGFQMFQLWPASAYLTAFAIMGIGGCVSGMYFLAVPRPPPKKNEEKDEEGDGEGPPMAAG